ncbi:hypothetical protein H0H93_001430 [Arthromyces matolae]|nr:hypothetical protein H0H93_001430 [Arthromyces matolae]
MPATIDDSVVVQLSHAPLTHDDGLFTIHSALKTTLFGSVRDLSRLPESLRLTPFFHEKFAGIVSEIFEYPFDLAKGLSVPIVGSMAETAAVFVAYSAFQDVIRLMTSRTRTDKLTIPELGVAAAGAGFVSSFVITPIELVKCKMQVQMMNMPRQRHLSTTGSISAALTPSRSFTMPMFSYRKRASVVPQSSAPPQHHAHSTTATKLPPGAFGIVRQTIRMYGLRGLWIGHTGTIVRETGGTAGWFVVKELVADALLRHRMRSADDLLTDNTRLRDIATELHPWESALSGAIAGGVCVVAFYPADTVKSAMQTVDELRPTNSTSTGRAMGVSNSSRGVASRALSQTFTGTLVRMYAAHGLKGLYAGCVRHLLTKSYVEGSLQPPLETSTLGEYFTSAILRPHSTRPALICRDEKPRAHHGPSSRNMGVTTHLTWDFAEFDRHINSLARGLLGMGVRKGDRVGVVMGNNSSYAMLQWACAHIGAILVTLNPAYRVHELLDTLRLVGVKHLFVVPRIRSSAYVEMLSHAIPNLKHSPPGNISCEELPELKNLVVVDNADVHKRDIDKLEVNSIIDWREILIWREDAKEREMQRRISDSLKKDDVINLQFTSGTTGAPKAVSVRRRNLAAWTHGACVVYPAEVFDPVAVIDAVVEERCTALHGVPTHFLGVLTELDKREAVHGKVDTSSLRTGVAAGSPIPIEMMKSLIARLNLKDLTNAYGMTRYLSKQPPQMISSNGRRQSAKSFLTSRPRLWMLLEIYFLLVYQASSVFLGTSYKKGGIMMQSFLAGHHLTCCDNRNQIRYWNDEEHTRSVTKSDDNGVVWMHTGDEGVMDEEGYLQIVSRIKDIIIRGGENLFPVQIENALLKLHDIEEAAVVSVPDEKYGEVVGAWIVRRPGTSASREEVRAAVAQSMNPQNAPSWVWFLGEDGAQSELPKTASGKVQKHILREWSRDFATRGVGVVQRT